MTHLTRRELEQWRDGGSAADRERVLGHLARCGDCAAEYAEIVRTSPVTQAPAVFDPRDFIETGYGVFGKPGAAARPWSWWVWRAAPLVAAGLLLFAVATPWLRDNDSGRVLRGGEGGITLVRPVEVEVPVESLSFEWTAAAGIDRVRLQVFDLEAPGQPLIRHELTGTRYEPPPDERARLPRGRELYWFVESRAAGSTTVTSPAASFRLK